MQGERQKHPNKRISEYPEGHDDRTADTEVDDLQCATKDDQAAKRLTP